MPPVLISCSIRYLFKELKKMEILFTLSDVNVCIFFCIHFYTCFLKIARAFNHRNKTKPPTQNAEIEQT